MRMRAAVFGIFPSMHPSLRAIDALIVAGFPKGDISVLMADRAGSKDFANALAVFTGIRSLPMPGLGSLIGAGPILAPLAGLGAQGAVGGFVGALAGLGIPENEAKRYESRLKDGRILLSIHCDTSEDVVLATETIERRGARDVSFANEEGIGSSRSPEMAESRSDER
jgi:hypothetical protein